MNWDNNREQDLPEAGGLLAFLYHTAFGRVILKLLSARSLSVLAGRYMDSAFSRWLIPVFIKKCRIDMREYQEEYYHCFNDFFTRHVKPELRPVDHTPSHFISPCDGLLRVYPIEENLVIPVKESAYTIEGLLKNRKLAAHYHGGTCMVFRLCVNHYHRYAYLDSGIKGRNHFIPGRLHTVQPIALEAGPVFTENCREYTLLKTDHFGTVLQMEVGAMLVGKISNHHEAGTFERGQEKGCFLYGGSTIILLLEPEKVELVDALYQAATDGKEIPVRFGECLGIKKSVS